MRFKKKTLSVALCAALLFFATTASAKPKYVFFFLGDGMSATQIQATEAFLTTENADSSIQDIAAREASELLKPENRLNMSKMSVAGMQTTYDAHALMTDSASSATAFACGLKTVSGTIGMDDAKTTSYKSIAQLAHEAGMNVGVLSSVSLDHATPAAYYASVASRNSYDLIDIQLGESGYEFFGGGGLKVSQPAGYTVLNTRDDIMALKEAPMEKVICINPWLQDSAAMPYDIDRLNSENDNLSLAEMTEVAIENLYALENNPNRHNKKKRKHNKKKGFFIMVEGGKIDWACHANDAVATIGDMLDFDNAIGKALAFYQDHPHETLIVVTGDHETGGMTIGHATTAYTAYYDRLLGQTNSFTYFGQNQWPAHKAANNSVCGSHIGVNNLENNADMLDLMQNVFGLDYFALNDYQKEKLEDAYDKSLCGNNDNTDDENKYLYGGYEPIIVTITHILNENASIGWTSYSHTGVPVPIFAEGAGADAFSGFYDNTDIAKKLASVMKVGMLPAVK
jgi:alkaline phosphatase